MELLRFSDSERGVIRTPCDVRTALGDLRECRTGHTCKDSIDDNRPVLPVHHRVLVSIVLHHHDVDAPQCSLK
jgi:hypothetical protein